MSELKDPAVLFFPSEFLLETMLMSYEAVGKFIKLLCGMFAHGHLSLDEIEAICGSDTKTILKQLAVDDKGLYYHVRLEHEMKNRKEFCDSRSRNASSKKKKTDNEEEKEDKEEKKTAGTGVPDCPKTEEKKAYGKENNVLLTDTEYSELKAAFGEELNDRIERVSVYLKESKKQYNSHFTLLKTWVTYKQSPRVDNQTYDDILEMANLDIQSSAENGGAFVRKMKMEAS